MKIKKLELYTHKLEEEKIFYTKQLGFEVTNETKNNFTVSVGWSELTFTKSATQHIYHYCFLIPSNKLTEALNWAKEKIELIEIQKGVHIQNFADWNADSFYFYDASGNIVEFIARYDLQNESPKNFKSSSLLGISEIGMPTNNIEKTSSELNSILNTLLWKGDLKRFAAHGDQNGLILLPNYTVKDSWFPTNKKLRPEPFNAFIETINDGTWIQYKNEVLSSQ